MSRASGCRPRSSPSAAKRTDASRRCQPPSLPARPPPRASYASDIPTDHALRTIIELEYRCRSCLKFVNDEIVEATSAVRGLVRRDLQACTAEHPRVLADRVLDKIQDL